MTPRGDFKVALSQGKKMGQKGFTLMELLMVMVLLGVFGSFFAQTVYVAGEAYRGVTTQEDLLRSGKIGLERMAREIRHVATPTGVDGTTLSSHEFSFRIWNGEAITYRFAENRISRNGVDLIECVDSFSFSYCKKDGTEALSGNELSCVEIAFTLRKGEESIPLRATLFPPAFANPVYRWYEQ